MWNFLEEFSDMHKDIFNFGGFFFFPVIWVKYIIIAEAINTS